MVWLLSPTAGGGSASFPARSCGNVGVLFKSPGGNGPRSHAIPLRGLEGVPGLPGALQDEAGITRKFETSHVGSGVCVRGFSKGMT